MFKNKTDFSLYLEKIKKENEFDTYLETVVFFYENETDQEMEDIAKLLNRKIIDRIECEASDMNMIQGHNLASLFDAL